jgi:type IV pilus assembly protein PilX
MYKNQCGIVLVVSLIMLLVMTLLGVSAMNTSLIAEKMAGNSRDVELAFQAAESGLREGESWISNQTVEPVATNDGSSRVWALEAMGSDISTKNQAWWMNNAEAYASPIAKVNTVPHMIIEYQLFVPDDLLVGNGNGSEGLTYYRVTSRGTGGSDQARVLLQSTTARRF